MIQPRSAAWWVSSLNHEHTPTQARTGKLIYTYTCVKSMFITDLQGTPLHL